MDTINVTIIDYGIGNIGSIANMIRKLDFNPIIISEPEKLRESTKIILPGVGSFDHAMKTLNDAGWLNLLNEMVLVNKVPVLGICLGMQLMCKGSEEGVLPGLSWIDAEVKRFKLEIGENIKVPHMGWNTISPKNNSELLYSLEVEQRFYFVHSFHVICNNPLDIEGTSSHGYEFVSAFHHENIYGVQFHPEKSHRFGMNLLNNFLQV
jgi:glutamine amidotransferase